MSDPKSPPIHGSFAGPPDHGVRFELLLQEMAKGRAVYAGHAHLPEVSLPLTVIAEAAAARATIEAVEGTGSSTSRSTSANAGLEKMAAALVRAATRAELAGGDPVPTKIVRWRPL